MEAITKPGDMLMDNLLIQANLTEMCKEFGVRKFLNVGSSCIYPVDGEQPYKEEQLGMGKTDENWSYAVAKLAGIEMCRAYHKQYGCNFMTVIPCNMYGINDNFGENGHVIPMLIRKVAEYNGEPIEVWGDGKALREFLYSDDFAEAAVILMEKYDYSDLYDGVINIGYGTQIPISTLFKFIVGYIANKEVDFYYTKNKPSGVMSKLLDSSRWKELSREYDDESWKPKISIGEGIVKVYEWFKNSTLN